MTTTAGIAAMAGLPALVMAPALAPNLDRLGFGRGLSRGGLSDSGLAQQALSVTDVSVVASEGA